jgi:hypothetical protein
VVPPEGDHVALVGRPGQGVEGGGEAGPLSGDQRARVDPEAPGGHQLEQQRPPDLPQVVDRSGEPLPQPLPSDRRRFHDLAGRAALPRLRPLGRGQAQRGQPVEGPVDDGAGNPPHGPDLGAGRERGRDVVAVAGPLGEAGQNGPLVQRQRLPALHASRSSHRGPSPGD